MVCRQLGARVRTTLVGFLCARSVPPLELARSPQWQLWTHGRLAILFPIDRSIPAAPTPQCAESVPLFAAQKGFRVGAQARRKPWRL